MPSGSSAPRRDAHTLLRSRDDRLDARQHDQLRTILARGVGQQPAVDAIEEPRVRLVPSELARQVRAQLGRARLDLPDEFGAPVEQADDVREVSARPVVPAPRPANASDFVATRNAGDTDAI
jgi:hypothetical protein